MKAWEIWSCQPAGWDEPHPAVIVSHPLRVANKPEVDVVMCSSRRAQRAPKPHEVVQIDLPRRPPDVAGARVGDPELEPLVPDGTDRPSDSLGQVAVWHRGLVSVCAQQRILAPSPGTRLPIGHESRNPQQRTLRDDGLEAASKPACNLSILALTEQP
jgi:hypothetical protein